MKSSDLLLYGGIAAAAYYAYSKGLLSNLFESSSTAAPAPSASAGIQVFAPGSNQLTTLPTAFTTPSQTILPNPAGNPAAQAAASSYTLGDLYTAMQYAHADLGVWGTPQQWNSVLASVSNILPPDPSVVFPGVAPTSQMRLETYWAGMAPWLAANKGMSGVSWAV